ncbi:uncharacterized protein LOC125214933 isoform X2 [Salvia hispanica]|uniref:uncharacterized protein LOC125188381 isoform X2 n=1 Tax=Salvia hispanica TaxID=49212 RepID=UPI002008F5CD|nr:uncharacterized protein LOC125188381 isoform X2 [Salvia hispanica]XP_047972128.1 uncharacterized protein LOC125214933 isoform X2 [Salvia hispanica]
MSMATFHGRRLSETTLAAVESLALPLVQEVVFLADFRCPKCQRRVAEIMAKMNGETQSVVISVLEKTVTLTCEGKPASRNSWSKTPLLLRLLRYSCN